MERCNNPQAMKIVLAEVEKLGPAISKFIDINQATLGWELDWIAANLWRYDDIGRASYVRRRIIARYHRNHLKVKTKQILTILEQNKIA